MTLNHAMGDEPASSRAEPGEFEAWYGREYGKVLGSLILATGQRDLAEEATAEAFARAYERWNRVGSMSSPRGWVYVVALNVARRRQRRLAMERVLLMHWRPPAEIPMETGFEVWDLVRDLPPRERTAVVLRYVADLSEAQVGKAMGITAGGVAKTLNSARSRVGGRLAATRHDDTTEERTEAQ